MDDDDLDLERAYARFLRAEPAPAARRVGEISMQILRATARNPDAAYSACSARIAETAETQAGGEPDFLAVILLALGTIFLRAARTAGGGDAPSPSSAAH